MTWQELQHAQINEIIVQRQPQSQFQSPMVTEQAEAIPPWLATEQGIGESDIGASYNNTQ